MGLFTLVNELPELTAELERLQDECAAEGIAFTTAPFGGVRNEVDTMKILGYRADDYKVYAAREAAAGRTPLPVQKWRPIAPYGDSFHNFGAGRDLWPTKYKGRWIVDSNNIATITDRAAFQAAHDRIDALIEAKHPKLRIGDYFNDEPHVELRITLEEARARYRAHLAIVALSALALVFLFIMAVPRG